LGVSDIFAANILVLSLRVELEDLDFGIKEEMVRQSTRRTLVDRETHIGSQEGSSRSGANQPSVYITRNEMETMTGVMQE